MGHINESNTKALRKQKTFDKFRLLNYEKHVILNTKTCKATKSRVESCTHADIIVEFNCAISKL